MSRILVVAAILLASSSSSGQIKAADGLDLGTSTTALSSSGRAKIRFNGTQIQASINGGAWSLVGGASLATGQIGFGSATSTVTGSGNLTWNDTAQALTLLGTLDFTRPTTTTSEIGFYRSDTGIKIAKVWTVPGGLTLQGPNGGGNAVGSLSKLALSDGNGTQLYYGASFIQVGDPGYLYFGTGKAWVFGSTEFKPNTDNVMNVGSLALRVNTVYATQIQAGGSTALQLGGYNAIGFGVTYSNLDPIGDNTQSLGSLNSWRFASVRTLKIESGPSTLQLISNPASTGTAVGHIIDTTTALTASGDRLLSIRTGGVEYFKIVIGSSGSATIQTGAGATSSGYYGTSGSVAFTGAQSWWYFGVTGLDMNTGIIQPSGDNTIAFGQLTKRFSTMYALRFDSGAGNLYLAAAGGVSAFSLQSGHAYIAAGSAFDFDLHQFSVEEDALATLGNGSRRWKTLFMGTDAIGTGTTVGVSMSNNTAAALNAQQSSPMLSLDGYGWSTGGAASRSSKIAIQGRPVQASGDPRSSLVFWESANGAAYTELGSLANVGGAFALYFGASFWGDYIFGGNSTFAVRLSGGDQLTMNTSGTYPGTDNAKTNGSSSMRWGETWSVRYAGGYTLVGVAASTTIGCFNGELARVALSATTITTITMSPGLSSQVCTVEIIQDATGSRAVPTAWTNALFAGGAYTATATANKRDAITFRYDAYESKWIEISRAMNQ